MPAWSTATSFLMPPPGAWPCWWRIWLPGNRTERSKNAVRRYKPLSIATAIPAEPLKALPVPAAWVWKNCPGSKRTRENGWPTRSRKKARRLPSCYRRLPKPPWPGCPFPSACAGGVLKPSSYARYTGCCSCTGKTLCPVPFSMRRLALKAMDTASITRKPSASMRQQNMPINWSQ